MRVFEVACSTKRTSVAMPKMNLSDLKTPILLVDYEKLENNIRSMAAKTRKNRVNLRPHIKTHKCIEIGEMQIKHGVWWKSTP